MFAITAEPQSSIIHLTFSGFLSVDEVGRFDEQFRSMLARGQVREGFALLIDIGAARIQSQDVIAAFQSCIEPLPRSRRIAIAAGPSLARRQISRVLPRSYARLFETVAEARAWLADPVALAA